MFYFIDFLSAILSMVFICDTKAIIDSNTFSLNASESPTSYIDVWEISILSTPHRPTNCSSPQWTKQHTLMLIDGYKLYIGKVGGMEICNLKMMWEKIAEFIKEQCYIDYSSGNCENRWRVLERNYKKYIDNNSQTGRGRKIFEFSEEMDAIFKKKKNIFPEELLSSSTVIKLAENTKQNRDECDKENLGEASSQMHVVNTDFKLQETPRLQKVQMKHKKTSELHDMRLDNKRYREEKWKLEKKRNDILAKDEADKVKNKKRRNEILTETLEARKTEIEVLKETNRLLQNIIDLKSRVCD